MVTGKKQKSANRTKKEMGKKENDEEKKSRVQAKERSESKKGLGGFHWMGRRNLMDG